MDEAYVKRGPVAMLGARVLALLTYLGGMALLMGRMSQVFARAAFTRKAKFGWPLFAAQMVRVGVSSVGIVVLVQLFIGVILALQMAPPLQKFKYEQQVPVIIGLAGFRMLGPIITAVVLSGFAGASIAAELGTMVVAEEIEAMEASAINPVRFLVMPRVLATFVMMVLLSVVSDMMIAGGGYITSVLALGPEVSSRYWALLRDSMVMADFYTGLIQAGVFGILISLIACYEGFKVTGGAEGVGRATTMTVVYSIVGIVTSACVFTMIFYVFKL